MLTEYEHDFDELSYRTDFSNKTKNDLGENIYAILEQFLSTEEIINLSNFLKENRLKNNEELIPMFKQLYFSIILSFGEDINKNTQESIEKLEEIEENLIKDVNTILEKRDIKFQSIKSLYNTILSKKYVTRRTLRVFSNHDNLHNLTILLENNIVKRSFFGNYYVKNKVNDNELLEIVKKTEKEEEKQLNKALNFIKKYKKYYQKDK